MARFGHLPVVLRLLQFDDLQPPQVRVELLPRLLEDSLVPQPLDERERLAVLGSDTVDDVPVEKRVRQRDALFQVLPRNGCQCGRVSAEGETFQHGVVARHEDKVVFANRQVFEVERLPAVRERR